MQWVHVQTLVEPVTTVRTRELTFGVQRVPLKSTNTNSHKAWRRARPRLRDVAAASTCFQKGVGVPLARSGACLMQWVHVQTLVEPVTTERTREWNFGCSGCR